MHVHMTTQSVGRLYCSSTAVEPRSTNSTHPGVIRTPGCICYLVPAPALSPLKVNGEMRGAWGHNSTIFNREFDGPELSFASFNISIEVCPTIFFLTLQDQQADITQRYQPVCISTASLPSMNSQTQASLSAMIGMDNWVMATNNRFLCRPWHFSKKYCSTLYSATNLL